MQAVADLFLPKRKFKPQQASPAQIFEPFPKQIKKVYHERHGDGVICYTSSPHIDEPFAVVAFIFATRIDTLQVPQSSLQSVKHPDTVRLDFIADKEQQIANIWLPRECVKMMNLHDIRAAIDMAIEMWKNESEKS
ncbi:hypothetical protein QG085_09695 [Kingella kingae]|uniref:hypothetical protein n=1 Tax=Kingella kingae TaxID=504 RepID=UPI00254F1B07|nr:hypothetical protein [Kingella kingae]MDK4545691.1 hypothetical protein [Kingella kingae]MDK4567611.1 hypothetical protein [Kingella kingae]MDK4629448.1 hypothetical protein [Kingella kingae]MDK4637339.1 hypothetical protein [Kingella kingae]MDK4639275.1 hypothetical protein [Kingella kingae]